MSRAPVRRGDTRTGPDSRDRRGRHRDRAGVDGKHRGPARARHHAAPGGGAPRAPTSASSASAIAMTIRSSDFVGAVNRRRTSRRVLPMFRQLGLRQAVNGSQRSEFAHDRVDRPELTTRPSSAAARWLTLCHESDTPAGRCEDRCSGLKASIGGGRTPAPSSMPPKEQSSRRLRDCSNDHAATLSVNVRRDAHHRGINDLEGENGDCRRCWSRARMELGPLRWRARRAGGGA